MHAAYLFHFAPQFQHGQQAADGGNGQAGAPSDIVDVKGFIIKEMEQGRLCFVGLILNQGHFHLMGDYLIGDRRQVKLFQDIGVAGDQLGAFLDHPVGKLAGR
jgi:hypothetical protein